MKRLAVLSWMSISALTACSPDPELACEGGCEYSKPWLGPGAPVTMFVHTAVGVRATDGGSELDEESEAVVFGSDDAIVGVLRTLEPDLFVIHARSVGQATVTLSVDGVTRSYDLSVTPSPPPP